MYLYLNNFIFFTPPDCHV